jgi:DNA polymerase Ligase (LigD)
MSRFAILAHDYRTPHWDLFLEAGNALRSWRIFSPLSPDLPVAAEPAPDHRPIYLDYEGPVSGGRGIVTRMDAGSFSWEVDSPKLLDLRLIGRRFVGRLVIEQTGSGWTCVFHPD